ncbi:phosphatidate cytidylyltransferase [Formicincola oecophyllae]|uniref:Phosphatidate cytidylyltransferase n=1 Tax=Formicincola oecophyllae TaxID=2558361 RepID=A0A4Y6U9J8_9PROT|nr:phosphatidate cytidylyltransferase [Formicincola oecophyllae]QDH13884.1 phosphatidate cytidylyltransferase [Formicincola oecophyllae]
MTEYHNQPAPDPSAPGRWRDLTARVLSSLVLVPLALGALVLGGPFWGALVLLATAAVAWEGASLLGQNMKDAGTWGFVGCVVLGVLLAEVHHPFWGLVIACCSMVYGRKLLSAAIVAFLGAGSLALLREMPQGLVMVLFVLAVVVAADTGAYVTGRLVGGPKLAPAISPGKTVSGAVGGWVAAMVAGVLVARFSGTAHGFLPALWALVLAVASQMGDLAESAFKRRVGVKDSGRLIPGHGGALDRFDGLLAAAPLALLIAAFTGRFPFWL